MSKRNYFDESELAEMAEARDTRTPAATPDSALQAAREALVVVLSAKDDLSRLSSDHLEYRRTVAEIAAIISRHLGGGK